MTTKKMLPSLLMAISPLWKSDLSYKIIILHMCTTKVTNVKYSITVYTVPVPYMTYVYYSVYHVPHGIPIDYILQVVDFLHPIVQKGKRLVGQKFPTQLVPGRMGMKQSGRFFSDMFFLQLLSRCPFQKWLIPLKLTVFNLVRKSSNR